MSTAPPPVAPADLEATIAALDQMDIKGLRKEWISRFGKDPPPIRSTEFLRLLLAWNLQAEVLGGLSPETRRRLDQLADAHEQNRLDRLLKAERRYKPGTTILKSWRGEEHVVMVLEQGFAWRGKNWASLSEIARAITGTRWNGPAFFGLRRIKSERTRHAAKA